MGRHLGHVPVIIHQASLGFFTWQAEASKSSMTRILPNSACFTLAKADYMAKLRDSVTRY